MTKRLCFSVLISLIQFSLYAQIWSNQVSGTSQDLMAVYFATDSDGWAVGTGGTILHTSNAGLNWDAQVSGTGNYLKSIFFATPTKGWAVGRFGTVLATVDGGNTWTPQVSGIASANLQAIEFSSETNGWLISDAGDILHTSDGGITWTAQVSTVTTPLYDLSVISANEIVVCGANGLILNTYDGGVNWNAITTSGTAATLSDIDFVTTTYGWVAGDNFQLLHSIDMGQTWSFAAPSPITVSALDFSDTSNGLIGLSNGEIYNTSDGSNNWNLQTSGTLNGIYGIFLSTSGTAWAVGDAGTIITLNNSASLNHELSENTVVVYPSPATEWLNVASHCEWATYAIFDLNGQLILKGEFPEDHQINVSFVESGVYIINIASTTGDCFTRRFIKE